MRKKNVSNVFIIMSMVISVNLMSFGAGTGQGGAVTAPLEESQARIFSSLDEAVTAPEQPVLLVFFSLACHMCWDELFEMKEFVKKYSIPVEIVGISLDLTEELQSFAVRYSFGHPIVRDRNKELYRRFKVKLEPHRVVLEKNRVIYQDDDDLDFLARRDKAKQCLLAIASR
ncbi:MAG: thioredoxin family protein [Clostridiales bacterium]|nr:thioredoxin family protein [Clostridiales bacterium]